MDLVKLKKQAKNLNPILRIGKNGLTDSVFVEVNKLLKNRDLVKIKILNNCSEDKNVIIDKVLQKTTTRLVSKMGLTFTIYRRK